MSASHRKISRLPLEVFENLDFHKTPPETLRSSISSRLKRFPVVKNSGSRNNNTNSASVKTIGDLLRTSKRTLLNALDPLLTYGTYYVRKRLKSVPALVVLSKHSVENHDPLTRERMNTLILLFYTYVQWKLNNFWSEPAVNALRNLSAPCRFCTPQPKTFLLVLLMPGTTHRNNE